METLTTASPTGTEIPWSGGDGTLAAWGTSFGSGSVKLQANFDPSVAEANWIDLEDSAGVVALASAKARNFKIAKCKLRAKLVDSTGATVPVEVTGIADLSG